MKPYQLLGLSFLVYLHRNGLSGILGDEMGLGKTLQTLSLIQYLKESRNTSSEELRPCLVVCPLSVLSSWIAESRRWTPGVYFFGTNPSYSEPSSRTSKHGWEQKALDSPSSCVNARAFNPLK